MPELPEVEAARRAVELHCKGIIRRAVVADDTTVIEGMAPLEMQQKLVSKRIVAAHRKGKQLWLEMDEPPSICFQFGMAGAVHIKGVKSTKYVRSAVKDEDEWPSKYSKVLLVLDSGVEMSFTDKRRFARVRLLSNPSSSPPISELGPDAFTELPDQALFAESVIKKKTSIKAVLLDQSFLAGIGNWIADEVLYQSRIHPEQPAPTLTAEDCERIRQAIKEVLERAVDAEADSSKYPIDWIYHHREKKAGSYVNGKKIEFITVGGRTSAYVPELQKYEGLKKEKTRSSKKKSKDGDTEENAEDDEEVVSKRQKSVLKKKNSGSDEGEEIEDTAKIEGDGNDPEPPKRRGRPPKKQAFEVGTGDKLPSASDEEQDEKVGAKTTSQGDVSNPPKRRGRGRPPKIKTPEAGTGDEYSSATEEEQDEKVGAEMQGHGDDPKSPKRRGRGRPRKNPLPEAGTGDKRSSASDEEEDGDDPKPPKRRGRGRPRKNPLPEAGTSDEEQDPKLPKRRGRGRPPKKKAPEAGTDDKLFSVSDEEQPPKRRGRGRPPKKKAAKAGTGDKPFSASDEDQDGGDPKPPKRGRGRPRKYPAPEAGTGDKLPLASDEEEDGGDPPKRRGRGRPRKNQAPEIDKLFSDEEEVGGKRKGTALNSNVKKKQG